jgi:hypothetical protein
VTVLVAVVESVVACVVDSVDEAVLAAVVVADLLTDVETVEVCVEDGEVISHLWKFPCPYEVKASFSS